MSSADATGIQAFPDALASREAWLEPFGWYREMREQAPVRYDPDRRCWDVFRYDDVKAVLGDDETFSVNAQHAADFEEPDDEAERLFFDTMLLQDPPRHDELRAVVQDSFRPGAVKELEPRIRELTAGLLEEALAGDDRFDVIEDLAYPLPVIVIAELLGIPPEQRGQFKRWSDALVAAQQADTATPEDAMEEMGLYFLELVEERRERPREDLVSTIAAEVDGATFTQQSALGTCMLLLVAGNITTTNLIGNAVRCFVAHDAFGTAAESERALQAAIEEVLRYRSPVQAMNRVAIQEVTIAGEPIEAGDRLTAWIGSANRDGRQFDGPDAFLPDRTPNNHLAFGHGTHYCLGAPLARLEAKVAFSELLDRVDRLELVDTELSPTRSSFVYGVESLPVRPVSAD